ncbi:unnamed protein product, partial [Gongylonema pulchrum]|uniref:EGF-like domain-containing protein n=1 Tax=Gongylonema pulchrum TaxID=637853 RepID=A0A183EGI4_9BILA
MHDGEMTIFVNSYLGHLQKTVIGRVYVEDKDDWDLPDKVFTWAPGKSLPGFSLATNGEITMDADMPPRTYQMVASVIDKRRNEKAQGVVNVIVKLVPAGAFENQEGVVVSANQTVVVGVNAWSNDTCVCPVFTPPSSCEANLCLNSGVCHNTYPGFFCECRNNALKGFRCQGTTRSFDGQGFAWFKPVPACTSLNISLQFLTKQSDGLLLYNGPMGNNNTFGQADYKDYVVIRLVGGRVHANLMFNGIVANPVQVAGSDALNDGKWHTVTLTQDGKVG